MLGHLRAHGVKNIHAGFQQARLGAEHYGGRQTDANAQTDIGHGDNSVNKGNVICDKLIYIGGNIHLARGHYRLYQHIRRRIDVKGLAVEGGQLGDLLLQIFLPGKHTAGYLHFVHYAVDYLVLLLGSEALTAVLQPALELAPADVKLYGHLHHNVVAEKRVIYSVNAFGSALHGRGRGAEQGQQHGKHQKH